MKHNLKPGQQYGSWTVIGNKTGKKIEVKCTCGTQKIVDVYSLTNGRSTNCGCQRRLKGQGDLTGTILYRNFARLEKKGPLSMSYDDAIHIYNSQGAACCLTGQTLTSDTAKLERIYSTGPATAQNVAWVHSSVLPMVSNGGIFTATNTVISAASNTSPKNIFETLGMKPAEKISNVQKPNNHNDDH